MRNVAFGQGGLGLYDCKEALKNGGEVYALKRIAKCKLGY